MAHRLNFLKCTTLAAMAANIPNWFSSTLFSKKVSIGRLSIFINWRRKDGLMGRFGGGWNWSLGFQAGGKSLYVSLLVFSVTFTLNRKAR